MKWHVVAAFVLCQAVLHADDGIGVGDPKIYDNRSLLIMLDQLTQTLSSAQFIDQKALAGALGMQQGFQSQDFSSSFAFSLSPTPASLSGASPVSPGGASPTPMYLESIRRTPGPTGGTVSDAPFLTSVAPVRSRARKAIARTPPYIRSLFTGVASRISTELVAPTLCLRA